MRLGYMLVAALTATLVFKTGLENQYYHHVSLMGLQVRDRQMCVIGRIHM